MQGGGGESVQCSAAQRGAVVRFGRDATECTGRPCVRRRRTREGGTAAALCVQPPDLRLQRLDSTATLASVGADERSRLRLIGVCVRLRADCTAVAALRSR